MLSASFSVTRFSSSILRPTLAQRFPSLAIRSMSSSSASPPSCLDESAECRLEYLPDPDSGVSVISFNRPAARNAIGVKFLAQLNEALDLVSFDGKTRVVIVRSLVDRIFCAGADLKERSTMKPMEVARFVSSLRGSFSRLESLPMPTICCIEGAALGGGLELAISCDMRIAAADARMGLPETGLAIIPGAGGTQRLPRLIGTSRAKELTFTARKISAEEADRYGLVNHVVDSGSTFNKALEIAREIRVNGPVAVRVAKIAIDQGMQMDRTSGMILEQQCYAQVIPTKDRTEGIRAFLEKRKPNFTGE